MDVLTRILKLALKYVSAPLRQLLGKLVEELEQAAKGTDNPVDDFFVEVLKVLLGMD